MRDSGCTKFCVLQDKTCPEREACPADSCETRSVRVGSFSDRPRSGTASSGLISQFELSKIEGRLARKFCFHIFHFQILREEVSHESFAFTSSAFTFSGTSRAKVSFSHLPLSVFEGGLARNAFWRDSGCTKCCALQDKTCPGRWVDKLVQRAVAEHFCLYRDAVALTVQAWFC